MSHGHSHGGQACHGHGEPLPPFPLSPGVIGLLGESLISKKSDGTLSTVPALLRLTNQGSGRVAKLLMTDSAIIDGIICNLNSRSLAIFSVNLNSLLICSTRCASAQCEVVDTWIQVHKRFYS